MRIKPDNNRSKLIGMRGKRLKSGKNGQILAKNYNADKVIMEKYQFFPPF